jgi:serine protease inhibitor
MTSKARRPGAVEHILYKLSVFLCNQIDGLAAIEKQLTASKLDHWISQLRQRRTKVYLPKFQAETSYQMKDTLMEMGMTSAFIRPSLGGANFSGMTTSDDPNLQLYINQVIHKASITVGEAGTEAAAATAMIMPTDSAPDGKMVDFTPTFRADRPFLFLIRDKRSGSILFLGRITQPGA